MIGLVGYTGFVGSNLKEQLHFDFLYNSKNIEHIEQEKFDLVIYSGVKAEKYLANLNPQKDYMHIQDSINNIKKVKADTFVLISTIDVYKSPHRVTESDKIEEDGLHSYGLHRRQLEKWVQQNIRNYLIVRLPSIYGNNMKKNFILVIRLYLI